MVAILVFTFSVDKVIAADMMPGTADVKVLLDNDEVKVSEATRSPGTIVPMNTHPKFFAYYLDATTVKLTAPNGKETVKNISAGMFFGFPEGRVSPLTFFVSKLKITADMSDSVK